MPPGRQLDTPQQKNQTNTFQRDWNHTKIQYKRVARLVNLYVAKKEQILPCYTGIFDTIFSPCEKGR